MWSRDFFSFLNLKTSYFLKMYADKLKASGEARNKDSNRNNQSNLVL